MQIYYVNLAHRPDRRAAMEAQFDKLGLSATRVEAITPADLAPAEIARYCNPALYHWLTEVELACSLSHIRVFDAIVASGAPFGMLLEDDVVLSARLPAFLAAFDAEPADLDILRLEADRDAMRVSPAPAPARDGVSLRQVFSYSSGAAGYIISRRAASAISSATRMRETQTDRVLFNPYEPAIRSGLVMRHADPALCIQLDVLNPIDKPPVAASSIAGARLGRRDREKAIFPRRVLHDLREGFDRDVRIGLLKAWHQYVGGAKKRAIPFAPD